MKSIRRGQGMIALFVTFFVIGMFTLVWKLTTEAEFYMSNADEKYLGKEETFFSTDLKQSNTRKIIS